MRNSKKRYRYTTRKMPVYEKGTHKVNDIEIFNE